MHTPSCILFGRGKDILPDDRHIAADKAAQDYFSTPYGQAWLGLQRPTQSDKQYKGSSALPRGPFGRANSTARPGINMPQKIRGSAQSTSSTPQLLAKPAQTPPPRPAPTTPPWSSRPSCLLLLRLSTVICRYRTAKRRCSRFPPPFARIHTPILSGAVYGGIILPSYVNFSFPVESRFSLAPPFHISEEHVAALRLRSFLQDLLAGQVGSSSPTCLHAEGKATPGTGA